MVVVEVGGETYHLDKKLHAKWMNLREGTLAKLDEDRVYIVDGRERVGKSLFTLQQACFIDPTLVHDVSRICFDPEVLLKKIRETKSTKEQTKCVVFDEAFRGLSSRQVLSKTNKLIVQTLMEMGQANLVLFIVLPSFFMLDKYPAISRSHALFHIYKEKGSKKRGFRIFNEEKKSLLHSLARRKGWGYHVYSPLRGKFYNKYPGGEKFRKLYLDKKQESFVKMSGVLTGDTKESKHLEQRNFLIKTIMEMNGLSQRKLAEVMEKGNYPMHHTVIGKAVKRVDEIAKEKENGEEPLVGTPMVPLE